MEFSRILIDGQGFLFENFNVAIMFTSYDPNLSPKFKLKHQTFTKKVLRIMYFYRIRLEEVKSADGL
jgi:hypothetical protein